MYHITRDELSPSLYENADFSRNTIKDSIKNGELKTNEILQHIGWEKWLQEMQRHQMPSTVLSIEMVVSNQIVREESRLKFTQSLSIAKDHGVLVQETVMY